MKPIILALICATQLVLSAAEPPKIGDKAPDFALQQLDGRTVRLSELAAQGNVVLIVLRGWPGYQCPLCSRQVQDYLASASDFDKGNARVVMVYPGPSKELKARAKEFLGDQAWPRNFFYLTDPDYVMVNAYGLRWKAANETAYPSTFVLDKKRIVRAAKVSRTHGDRTNAADILKDLESMHEN